MNAYVAQWEDDSNAANITDSYKARLHSERLQRLGFEAGRPAEVQPSTNYGVSLHAPLLRFGTVQGIPNPRSTD